MSPRKFVTAEPFADQRLAESRVISLVQAYLAADYRWELDGQWHPMTIGARATALEAAFPQADSFGLLSAWNPHSVDRPDEDNRADDEALNAALLAGGHPFKPAFSSARNRTWREPSWIVMDMPVAAFDALAQRFRQLATVHGVRGEPVRLRVYRAAPAGAADQPLVDWVR
jgi:hypothetical protein